MSAHRFPASVAALLLLAGGGAAFAQEGVPRVGPVDGSLVIAGGGNLSAAIRERFLELAGGPESAIVVVPTNGTRDHFDEGTTPDVRQFKAVGAKRVSVLHTRDRRIADSPDFSRPIREAQGVWISGGRQWRGVDAYLGTRVHEELRALLRRGGVIGGTSAGASIQGSYLVRGDTKTNQVMMGDHEEGFGFLKNVAIDQHLIAANRQFDLWEVIKAHPTLLGIGIDEDTAIVVRGDRFEVIGSGVVAIYDNQSEFGSRGWFYFLKPGDYYDLDAREPLRRDLSSRSFQRVGFKKGAAK
jgi:cyanophycinase